MFFSNQENSWEQKNEEEAITDLPNISFSATDETRLSEEDDETEESLPTVQKDNEAQVEFEEPSEPVQKDDDVQMVSEPLEPVQQTQVEPEEEESIQQTQIEPEESSEPDQICDETQMESEESSEDVQMNNEEKSEEPPVEKKLKVQQKASTNRVTTNRASTSQVSINRGSINRGSVNRSQASTISASAIRGSTNRAPANRVSTNRTTTNRALTRQGASTAQASTSSASTSRVTKNRASNPTTLSNPSNPIETPSPIARMLPNKRHWKWASNSRVSGGNQYFTAIRRGRETINIGDSVLFYSYRKPHEKPYIGKIVSLWLNQKLEMRVRSQWFYRPEELQPPCSLNPPVILPLHNILKKKCLTFDFPKKLF